MIKYLIAGIFTEMYLIQHTTKLDESSFKSFCLCYFLLLCTIEISLIVGLCLRLKSLSYFSGKNRYDCYR